MLDPVTCYQQAHHNRMVVTSVDPRTVGHVRHYSPSVITRIPATYRSASKPPYAWRCNGRTFNAATPDESVRVACWLAASTHDLAALDAAREANAATLERLMAEAPEAVAKINAAFDAREQALWAQ